MGEGQLVFSNATKREQGLQEELLQNLEFTACWQSVHLKTRNSCRMQQMGRGDAPQSSDTPQFAPVGNNQMMD